MTHKELICIQIFKEINQIERERERERENKKKPERK